MISFLFPNNVNIIPNNFVYNKKHLCIGMICLLKCEEVRIVKSNYPLSNKKRPIKKGSILI
jgi:hypothetical protein